MYKYASQLEDIFNGKSVASHTDQRALHRVFNLRCDKEWKGTLVAEKRV
jgi:hypothetical protein